MLDADEYRERFKVQKTHSSEIQVMFASVRGCARVDKGVPLRKVLSYQGYLSDTTTN